MRIVCIALACGFLLLLGGGESPPSTRPVQMAPTIVPMQFDAEQRELMEGLNPGSSFYLVRIGDREIAGIELNRDGTPASLMVWRGKGELVMSIDARDGVYPGSTLLVIDPAAHRGRWPSGINLVDEDLDGIPDRKFEYRDGKLIGRWRAARVEWVDDLNGKDAPPRLPPPPSGRAIPEPGQEDE